MTEAPPAPPAAETRFLGMRRSFLGRLPVALIFATLSIVQAMALAGQLRNWPEAAGPERWLGLASTLTGGLFSALIVATTCLRRRPVRQAEGLGPRLVAIAGGFLSLLLAALPQAALPASLQVVAIGMVTLGTALSIQVLWWLGRSFSVLAEARRLVTGGPYRLVRHPLYVAEQIAVLGIVLLHLSPLALAILAVQLAAQFRRMRAEEAVLAAAFPEYAAYAARTPRLVPAFRAGPARAPAQPRAPRTSRPGSAPVATPSR